MVDIGLGVVALRKVAVGKDTLAAVDLGYGEEHHMADAEMGGILVVVSMDCVKELRMVVVGVVGSPGCTGPAVDMRSVAAAVTAAASLVRL